MHYCTLTIHQPYLVSSKYRYLFIIKQRVQRERVYFSRNFQYLEKEIFALVNAFNKSLKKYTIIYSHDKKKLRNMHGLFFSYTYGSSIQ